MSKVVCHVAKFQRSAIPGLQHHDQRTQKNNSNKDIDVTRSHQNYDIQNPDAAINFRARIDEILATQRKTDENASKIRKDAVLCVDVLISSEKAFFERLNASEQQKYFRDAHEFLKSRFGSENIIAATVHMDEQTPHMHWKFVPITRDGKLSGKKVISQASLRQLQQDLPLHLQSCGWNIERGIENNQTKHVQPEDYKKQLEKQIAGLDAQLADLKKRQKNHSRDTLNAYEHVKNIEQTATKIPFTDKYAIKGDDLKTLCEYCVGAEKAINFHSNAEKKTRSELDANSQKITQLEMELDSQRTSLNRQLVDLRRDLTAAREKAAEMQSIRKYLEKKPNIREQLETCIADERQQKNRGPGR